MGISDSDISRLLAGEIPSDDPELGGVSSFLASMQTAIPPTPPTACADRHLAVMTREARLVAAARVQDRRNTVPGRVRIRLQRALAAVAASVLVALTAGVGVASAMGVNPLQLVTEFVVGHPASPETGSLDAGADERTDDPADGPEGDNPFTPVVDPSAGSPSPADGQPTATSTPTEDSDDADEDSDSDEDSADKSDSDDDSDEKSGKDDSDDDSEKKKDSDADKSDSDDDEDKDADESD